MKEIYRHFKGGIYELISDGILESNMQEMVVYKSLKDEKIWIRPKKEFFESIIKNEKEIKRFTKIDSSGINDPILICSDCNKLLSDKDLYRIEPIACITESDEKLNFKRKEVFICCNKIRMVEFNNFDQLQYDIPPGTQINKIKKE
jgi:hypothetical protein